MESSYFPSKSSFAIFVWLFALLYAFSHFENIDSVYSSYTSAKESFSQSLDRLHQYQISLFGAQSDDDEVEDSSSTPAARAAIPKNDLQCMAENIYYEAGNQSYAGKIAVGQVVLNRTKQPGFPSTVCGVIYEGSVNTRTSTCQFSWTCGRKAPLNKNSVGWEQSLKVAKELLDKKDSVIDITDGATSYHANYVKPVWSKQLRFVAQIDQHLFYRMR